MRQTELSSLICATRPGPCAQIGQPWILHPRPRRHASRSQRGYRQPRKLLEDSFRADRGRTSAPVLMKPFASSARPPRSHSVLGSAPVIINTCWMSRISLTPVLVLCKRTRSRCVSPSKRLDPGPSHESNPRARFYSGNQVSRHGFRNGIGQHSLSSP
jgi:hypothetical protein